MAMLALSCLTMTLLFAALAAATRLTPTLIVLGLLFCAQRGALPLIDVLAFAIFAPGGPAASGALEGRVPDARRSITAARVCGARPRSSPAI
jgi:hypothetical protein